MGASAQNPSPALEALSAHVGKRPNALQFFLPNNKVGSVSEAQPKRRRIGRKSMSRRSGQIGTIVIQSGWYRVRWRMDVEGQQERTNMSEKVAPVVLDRNGSPKPPSQAVRRMARELVERSGANSEQHFNRVVLGEVTFREQAKAYLRWVATRDREPIKDTSSIEAALNKWILPEIGDLPLGSINNVTVKPLVTKMKPSLSACTVNKYIEYVQQVVASQKNGETGEPIHHRKWDSSVMDLPVVKQKEQRRPALKAKTVNQLVQDSEGDEQGLYIIEGAAGMRISEALALETGHFINNCRTILIRQQIDRDTPIIGTPYLHNNLENRWLTPRLKTMGVDEPGLGWHGFRRFRKTWLRSKRCQEDINLFWMGHKPKSMSELYSRLDVELDLRLAEADLVGVGFETPIAPKCSKNKGAQAVEVAA